MGHGRPHGTLLPSKISPSAPHTPQLRLVAFVGSSRLSGPPRAPLGVLLCATGAVGFLASAGGPTARASRSRREVGYGADLGGVSGAANVSWQPPPADQITRTSTACHFPRPRSNSVSYSTRCPGTNSLQPSRFFACTNESDQGFHGCLPFPGLVLGFRPCCRRPTRCSRRWTTSTPA